MARKPEVPGPASSIAETLIGPSPSPEDPRYFFNKESKDLKSIGNVAINDLFFNFLKLEAADAWKVYPYEFQIHDGSAPISTLTMPLSPESISISVPAAVSTTVTMRGITEEHNAAPLRQITITGTAGIMSDGRSSPTQAGPSNALDYAFKNTIQAFGRARNIGGDIIDTAKTVASLGAIKRSSDTPVVDVSELENGLLDNGYKAIHNMSRFFDRYLAAKKVGATKMFLSFYMNKDKMYYDCTLNNYSIRKVAGSMEYQYTITLTAWRRRQNRVGERPDAITRPALSSNITGNIFTRVTQTIDKTTDLLSQIGNIQRGISADFDTAVLAPIKSVGLLSKTVLGVFPTMSDFPSALWNQWQGAFKQKIRETVEANERQEEVEVINNILVRKGRFYPWSWFRKRFTSVFDWTVESQESTTKTEGSPERNEEEESVPDPLEEAIKDEESRNEMGKLFTPDELDLSPEVRALVDAQIDQALSLTANDVREIKRNYDDFIATYSQFVGGGSATYNRINGRGTGSITTKQLSVDDINRLNILNEMSSVLDTLTVFLDEVEASQTPENDYASYFAQQAQSYGIDFQENTSKFYVPFEFGSSLERMAVKYLGSADRWIELAAINALKSPYVDEEGFLLDFTSNGASNSFSISSPTNLYIGQVIELSSDTQRPEPRKIESIDQVSSIETIITVDGEPDLFRYSLLDNAKVRAFLPNTINSNQLIAIPSTVPVNIPGSIRLNPDREDLNLITLTAKADFLLTYDKQNNSDIAFSGSDVRIARGLQNLQQAASIKVLTPQGDLLNDPEFGNPVQVGSSSAEVDAAEVIEALSAMFESDPRFQNIIAGRVNKNVNALIVDMVIGVNNSQAYLPFTAAIPFRI